jgi:hypothetical protein
MHSQIHKTKKWCRLARKHMNAFAVLFFKIQFFSAETVVEPYYVYLCTVSMHYFWKRTDHLNSNPQYVIPPKADDPQLNSVNRKSANLRTYKMFWIFWIFLTGKVFNRLGWVRMEAAKKCNWDLANIWFVK